MSQATAARNEPAAEDGLSAILLDQADRLFAAHIDRAALAEADGGAWPAALWAAVEDAGFPAALVPVAAGGVGFGHSDVMQLIRRSAYHALPLPLAETMIAGALWAEASGEMAEGVLTLAPANASDRLGISQMGGDYVLSGTARRIPWGSRADNVLAFARDAARTSFLALVPAGALAAGVQKRRSVANEPRDTLCFDGVTLPAACVRAAPVGLGADGLLLHGAAIRAQQMVGGMERALDHALSYANERVQFGRAIGKFQAVQHMLAVAAGHYAAATATADAVAESFESDQFTFWVAAAKSRVGEAAGLVAATCHQVHAAMGFTQEHPLHYATRRLWSWRDEFGSDAFWQRLLGEAACKAGGEALWPTLVRS